MCDVIDDDKPQLSEEALRALEEFYKEREEIQKFNMVDEDWQLSQFWYNDHTVDVLTKVATQTVEKGGKIALISCPTLYEKIKDSDHFSEVALYEYDKRFSKHGDDFHFYDYKSPLCISEGKEKYYDLVIADPPFLSEECLEKFSITIKFIGKSKIILCTGSVMTALVERFLGLQKCKFNPEHQANLGNDFSCFSNYNLDEFV